MKNINIVQAVQAEVNGGTVQELLVKILVNIWPRCMIVTIEQMSCANCCIHVKIKVELTPI